MKERQVNVCTECGSEFLEYKWDLPMRKKNKKTCARCMDWEGLMILSRIVELSRQQIICMGEIEYAQETIENWDETKHSNFEAREKLKKVLYDGSKENLEHFRKLRGVLAKELDELTKYYLTELDS